MSVSRTNSEIFSMR